MERGLDYSPQSIAGALLPFCKRVKYYGWWRGHSYVEVFQETRGERHTGEKWKSLSGHISSFRFSLYFETGSLIVDNNLELLIFMPKLIS